MITIEPISLANALHFKDARLRALRDTPLAFGSTYARESQLPDSEWLNRAAQWNGSSKILFLAMDHGNPCGVAGGYLYQDEPARAQLISMWVAPTHRQRGLGRRLVSEVFAWARSRGAHTVLLLVTSSNEPAIFFYEHLGFTLTGRTEPYPNDRTILECEMSRAV
jgi:ribosomal protein S18 acetylase RimI-like enzyme